jgi:hypothetical protein
VPSPLAVYLRNHAAAAQAGGDLFRRTVSNHRRKPYAEELRQLAAGAREDLFARLSSIHQTVAAEVLDPA